MHTLWTPGACFPCSPGQRDGFSTQSFRSLPDSTASTQQQCSPVSGSDPMVGLSVKLKGKKLISPQLSKWQGPFFLIPLIEITLRNCVVCCNPEVHD